MKIRKVIIFFIFLILFILFMPCNKVKAYTCSEYYVDINVGEDNVFDVIEKYTVRNDRDKYSCDKIVRNIPLTNSLTSDDDKKSDNKVQITDINASCDYYYRETSDGKEEINMNFLMQKEM